MNISSEPLVSVLISAHNASSTIDRCMTSIINQTTAPTRIICIDDASSDNTLSLLKKWQQKFSEDKFLLLQNKENIGLTKSLNLGLTHITTMFTARLDADDWWEPKKLEKQLSFLKTNPTYDIVGTNYINHTDTNTKKVVLPETNDEIKKVIFWQNPFGHSCVVYRTELIRQVGMYDASIRYAQDYELWMRCLPIARFYNVQEFLCHRTLGNTISIQKQNEQMRQYIKVLRKYIPLYKRPLKDYGAMIEPMIILTIPEWVKRIKRNYFL